MASTHRRHPRRDRERGGIRWWALAVAPLLVAVASAARAEPPFEFREIDSPGRTAAAEIADFDGDGRNDLLSVNFSGLPPNEVRQVRLYRQREDGTLPAVPDRVGALPSGAAVYDIADLPDGAGVELVLLTRDGISVLSFSAGKTRRRDIEIPIALLVVGPDERSLDRMQLVRADLGAGPRLLIPGFLECAIIEPSGELVSRLYISGRANYYMPPRPGPLVSGSEIEIHFDHPRINSGDVDGDGRGDVVAADRHEIRVFRQREDGTFPPEPDASLPVARVSENDHIRSSGNLAIDLQDFDRDGRADLLVSHSSGGLFQAHSESRVHLNREGSWDLERPDQVFTTEGGMATVQLLDLDGDGAVELIDGRIPMGAIRIVDMLLTRTVDTEVAIYRIEKAGRFGDEPWFRRDVGIPFNLETNRPYGFFPNYDSDLNGDGARDLLTSGKGDVVDVYLGGENRYKKRAARQKIDSGGRLRFGDLDGDRLADLLLYDPLRPGTPIRIGRNLGTLPGTRPEIQARPD